MGQPKQPDLYALLGLDHTAKQADILSAYRRLARQQHPDIDPSPEAHERMKILNRAYSILRNSGKRAEYDARRRMARIWTDEDAPTGVDSSGQTAAPTATHASAATPAAGQSERMTVNDETPPHESGSDEQSFWDRFSRRKGFTSTHTSDAQRSPAVRVIQPDGQTEEWPLLAAALASATSGSQLILEGGTYAVDTLDINKSVEIRATGRRDTVVIRLKHSIRVSAGGVTIRDLTVHRQRDGGGDASPAWRTTVDDPGVLVIDGDQFVLHNCHIRTDDPRGRGVDLRGRAALIGGSFISHPLAGIAFDPGAIGSSLENNTITARAVPIAIWADHVTVARNRIEAGGYDGFSTAITIEGNAITVRGNTLNCASLAGGIVVRGPETTAVIEDNLISNPDGAGLTLAGREVTVRGNRIEGSSGVGIEAACTVYLGDNVLRNNAGGNVRVSGRAGRIASLRR